jgi:hypothetical protein
MGRFPRLIEEGQVYHGINRGNNRAEELGRTPAERRKRWRARLRSDQDEAELALVRTSLKTGRPVGAADWIERVANRLGIELDPRPRGRPPKGKIDRTRSKMN